MVNLTDNSEPGEDSGTTAAKEWHIQTHGSVVGAAAPPPSTSVHVAGGGLMGGERQKEPRLETAAQAQTDENGNVVYGPPTIDEHNTRQGILALTGPPTSMEPRLMSSRSESALSTGAFGNQGFSSAPGPIAYTAPGSTTNFEHLDENRHHYVGLVNQAMTCYLNSLIQTLYMTPEFRNAIYSWQFAGTQREEGRNIPFQLQRLFLLLQTSDKYSLETKDLTSSFGWESNDAYEQHDVQELCRLMFDALEHKWRNTENRSLIQDLYKGTMEDYVACKKCGTVRAKPDSFLDIPLAVREFGAKESYRSVEEALSAFVKPELLDGDNQYSCDKCKSKQNAEKGLRFTQFPYLLTIQLKRFDFDYQTLHRIKLNDRVTFPDILDLNRFLHREHRSQPQKPQEVQKAALRSYANVASTSRSLSQDTIEEEEVEGWMWEASSSKPEVESDAGAQKTGFWTHWKRDSTEVLELMKRNGRHIYELFSIMVHQGSASGGHYYCYIKNLSQDKWFCFNDSSVQTASMADVYKTFGGGSGGWSVSNTNAYMLMYRRIDAETNRDFVRSVDLPKHLIELKERVAQEEVERVRQQRELEEMVRVNFFVNSSANFYSKCVDGFETVAEARYMNINRNICLSDVLETLVGVDGGGASAEARLITCDRYWNMQEAVRDYTAPLSSLMRDGYYPHYRDEVNLVMDTKVRDEFYAFPEREVGKNINSKNLCTLDVIQVVLSEQRMQLEKRICIDNRWSLTKLRQVLFAILPEAQYPDMESICRARIVADHPADDTVQPILLQDDSKSLETIPEIRQIMVQFSSVKAQLLVDSVEQRQEEADRIAEEDRKRDFHDSLLFKIIDARKHRMRLKIVLPNKIDYQHVGMLWKNVELAALPRPLINVSSPRLPLLLHQAAPELVLHSSDSPPSIPTAMEGCQLPVEYSAGLSVGDAPQSLSSLGDECTVSATLPLMVEPGQGSPTSSSSNDSNDHAMEQGSGGVEDEQMDVSSMSTPKRSPVVSDASEGEGEEAPFSKHAKSGGDGEGIGWRQAEINSKLERLIEESSAIRQMGPIGQPGAESLSMHNSNTVVTTMSTTSHHNLRPTNSKGKEESTGGGDQETVYGGESTTTDSSTPSTSTIKAAIVENQQPQQLQEGGQDQLSGPYSVAVVHVVNVNCTSTVDEQKQDEQGGERSWIEVEVDRRQLCSDLKRWLANYLQIPTDSFHLFKHYSEMSDGYGCFSSSPAAIRDTFSSINHLSVKLDVQRSEDERPLPIHKFERGQPDLQKWPLLFYIAVAKETTVGEVLTRCRELLHTIYGFPDYKAEQWVDKIRLRLRDLTESGAVVLKRAERLEVRGMAWFKALYLEVIEDEDAASWPDEERSVPVMVIQWCPASADVKPLGDLQLRSEVKGESKALRKLIAQHTTLPVERIQLAEPCPSGANSQWVKWPFTRSTIDLIDGLVKFYTDNPPLPLDGSYGGKLVYFKDSNEFSKSVSEEERKAIKIKESAQTSALQSTSFMRAKRERPLRIQMHSICEGDP